RLRPSGTVNASFAQPASQPCGGRVGNRRRRHSRPPRQWDATMRDYRDAKAMAQSLRQALSDRSVTVTHSDCLELVSKAFGFDNWNILAAKIEAARPVEASANGSTLYCSFCGKSQHDADMLIAGPNVHICNGCVGLCDGIVVDRKLSKTLADARAA